MPVPPTVWPTDPFVEPAAAATAAASAAARSMSSMRMVATYSGGRGGRRIPIGSLDGSYLAFGSSGTLLLAGTGHSLSSTSVGGNSSPGGFDLGRPNQLLLRTGLAVAGVEDVAGKDEDDAISSAPPAASIGSLCPAWYSSPPGLSSSSCAAEAGNRRERSTYSWKTHGGTVPPLSVAWIVRSTSSRTAVKSRLLDVELSRSAIDSPAMARRPESSGEGGWGCDAAADATPAGSESGATLGCPPDFCVCTTLSIWPKRSSSSSTAPASAGGCGRWPG
mmetsp:Transcript_5849/g.18317  ORF Transcript_5849/g.18317 Transcript_5849/m.18317 type:complete len:277 (-) Transcript_5849:964-1794(-)